MIGIIAAVSLNNVIGKNGKLPWYYSADLQWFRRCTRGHTVIMGRKTWESIGSKPLSDRQNVVISKSLVNGGVYFVENDSLVLINDSLSKFIDKPIGLISKNNVWFIGGRRIFEEAFEYADTLYLTEIPEVVTGENLIYFPEWDRSKWQLIFSKQNAEDERLWHFGYRRIK